MSKREHNEEYIEWLKSLGCVFYGLNDDSLVNHIDGGVGTIDSGASAVYGNGGWTIRSSQTYKGGVVFNGNFLTKYAGLTLADNISATMVIDCYAINETGDYYSWMMCGTNSSDIYYAYYIGKYAYANPRNMKRRVFIVDNRKRKYYEDGILLSSDTDTRNWTINTDLSNKIIIGGGSYRTGSIFCKNAYFFDRALTLEEISEL